MNIVDKLIGVLAPHDCMMCGAEGSLLCNKCLQALPRVPERCYNCRNPSDNYLVCEECSGTCNLNSVKVATVYGEQAKELIWRLKLAGARTAADIMAEAIAPLLSSRTKSIIVPVPTATSRSRQRGFDQAYLIARAISRKTGLPVANVLARSGQMHQHGLSREQRLQQLTQAYRVKHSLIIRNANLVLVDDVITTGSTLEAAAGKLLAAGAKTVDATVFAQPEFHKQ